MLGEESLRGAIVHAVIAFAAHCVVPTGEVEESGDQLFMTGLNRLKLLFGRCL
jgi:hypothetical protein